MDMVYIDSLFSSGKGVSSFDAYIDGDGFNCLPDSLYVYL